ncbi:hypothetical protein CDL15_Pgr000974 [Punica granatum]|uniref:Uncharacterized protein n=1 Tax=Punica granatum TaxID=22663 RepID=A0A218XHZ2_PUNGR|nr:hypothetical protein CDL15_Pgr000974 [Punica granatum]
MVEDDVGEVWRKKAGTLNMKLQDGHWRAGETARRWKGGKWRGLEADRSDETLWSDAGDREGGRKRRASETLGAGTGLVWEL